MTTEDSYAGDISPPESWTILADDPKAVLIDVRTRPEWAFVGVPELSSIGKTPHFLEWALWPDNAAHPDFVGAVRAAGVPEDAPVLLLCRSGVRSKHAAIALTAAGFTRCYNIEDGFEGHLDDHKHRGAGDTGWKSQGLPWVQ